MGILKTAIAAGVATRVAGNVHRRQQRRWAAEDQRAQAQAPVEQVAVQQPPVQQAPTPQPPAEGNDMLQQLTQLGQLRDSGVLTDAEFETQKARILAGG